MLRLLHVARTGLWLAAVAGAAACTAPHKLISARHTSCATRKLEISNLTSGADREDWIARCGDKRYACSTREKARRLVYACRLLPDDGGAPNDSGATNDAGVPNDGGAPGDGGT